jgi:hypothetical protein
MTEQVAETQPPTNSGVESARKEFDALQQVFDALLPLSESARDRVVRHVAGMLNMVAPTSRREPEQPTEVDPDDDPEQTNAAPTLRHATFAEFFNAIDPQTAADKALAAGYWLQVCEGADSFDGQRANKELTHLGHKVTNITNALTALNDQRPSLAIQLKKSGNTQQARKTYKITAAGEAAIREKLNG